MSAKTVTQTVTITIPAACGSTTTIVTKGRRIDEGVPLPNGNLTLHREKPEAVVEQLQRRGPNVAFYFRHMSETDTAELSAWAKSVGLRRVYWHPGIVDALCASNLLPGLYRHGHTGYVVFDPNDDTNMVYFKMRWM